MKSDVKTPQRTGKKKQFMSTQSLLFASNENLYIKHSGQGGSSKNLAIFDEEVVHFLCVFEDMA